MIDLKAHLYLRFKKTVKMRLQSSCAILYYTILYCTILYYTIPYYTILYYTMLYYTMLYYTIIGTKGHAIPAGS